MPSERISAVLLERALDGDRSALHALFEELSPIIQARVVRVLLRKRGASNRDTRQEVMDLTQETFVALLEDGGRALRAWRHDGGLSLENFVGLFAERQALSILRTGRRSPWKDEPMESDALDARAGAVEALAETVESRQLFSAVLDRLREELTPYMLNLFYALWVDELPVPTICERFATQPDAVYAARSRIAKRARAIAHDLEHDPANAMSDRRGMATNPLQGER
jgi:RNA polymerase sigma-70 factor (ECF subfamily)